MSRLAPTQAPKFEWQLNWKICVFFLVFFPLMVGLGFWQLDRAQQKRTIQQMQAQQQGQAPVQITELGQLAEIDSAAGQFTPVQLRGRFDTEHLWLLENQTMQGRLGFHVVQALELERGGAVLVDRGWLAHDGNRARLPQIDPAASVRMLEGQLKRLDPNRLLEAQQFSDGWPRWILQIAPDELANQIKTPLSQWLVQISPQDPAAFTVQWRNVVMSSDRHIGYAFQWFAMAFALLVLTIYANSNLHSYVRWRLSKTSS